MALDEKTARDIDVTAQALGTLADRGLAAIQDERHNDASAAYDLMQQLAYSLATSMKIISANNLKEELLPEDLLKVRHTGAEDPLTDSGAGHYL